MRELYSKFARVGESLLDLSRYCAGLTSMGRAPALVDDPDSPLQRATRSCTRPFRIVLTGPFAAGTTTLVNALLKRENLVPLGRPEAGFPTIIRKGSETAFRVKWLSRANSFNEFNHAMARHKVRTEVLTLRDLDTLECEAGDLLDAHDAIATIRAFRTFLKHYDEIVQIPVTQHNRHMFFAGGGFTGGRYYHLRERDEL